MVNIKKQKLKGYILLESLVGLALLVTIVSLVLGEFTQRQKRLRTLLEEQERLNVAIMAVQTGQNYLALNGVSVSVERIGAGIRIYSEKGELVYVSKD